MKVLVTGGSGYLGRHVREFFGADDLSRSSGLDICRTNDAGIASDYDIVIHLAAHLDKAPNALEEVFLTNVEGTVNLLRCVKPGATFIFASTKDVYGRFADKFAEVPESCQTLYSGQTALEWSKLIGERYVEFYAHSRGFRSCIFRMSTVYAALSPNTTPNFVGGYVDAINKGDPIRFPGGGRPRRDLLHVDDFSSACRMFAESVVRHGLYNIGGGRGNAISLRELVAKMEEVSGLQAIIDDEQPLPDPVPFNYVSDLSLVKQELGWEPRIGIVEGLEKLFRV